MYDECKLSSSSENHRLRVLLQLVQHRWSIPIIELLARRNGAKFVTLAHELGVSRGVLTSSLKYLQSIGLVCRNPGHGHPLRPEYLLSPQGEQLSGSCAALMRLLRKRDELHMALCKWSLPTVLVVGREQRRFGEIRSALGDPTPRAVTLSLKALQEHRWIRTSASDSAHAAYSLAPLAHPVWKLAMRLGEGEAP